MVRAASRSPCIAQATAWMRSVRNSWFQWTLNAYAGCFCGLIVEARSPRAMIDRNVVFATLPNQFTLNTINATGRRPRLLEPPQVGCHGALATWLSRLLKKSV